MCKCLDDFNMMWKNCYVYNKPGEDVVIMAQTLEKLLLSKIAQMPPEVYKPFYIYTETSSVLNKIFNFIFSTFEGSRAKCTKLVCVEYDTKSVTVFRRCWLIFVRIFFLSGIVVVVVVVN